MTGTRRHHSAERVDVRERHQDAGAAAVAELVLEVQLARYETGWACSAAKRRAPQQAEPHSGAGPFPADMARAVTWRTLARRLKVAADGD